jgi:hypothetical protein
VTSGERRVIEKGLQELAKLYDHDYRPPMPELRPPVCTARFEVLPDGLQRSGPARVALALCVLFIGLGSRAQAQEPPKYEVTGFRDARFGMTEPEVRAAIKKSFAVKDADIKTSSNPTEGTTLLIARVESSIRGQDQPTLRIFSATRAKD